jgi:sugar phosphate isomerase/epimerase
VRLTRRALLGAATAAAFAGGARSFRLAICSETFAGMQFAEACRAARRTGYTGLEVAPADLGPDPAGLPPERRRQIRGVIADSGLTYVGTHSLLAVPKGLHLTTPDRAVREKSWDYFRRLIDLSADLGTGTVMVLGSSKQRAAVNGATVAEATGRLEEGLARLAPAAQARGVTILLEPLAPHLCNVVNTLEEAVAMVKRIASRAIQSMFDTHNTAGETLPHEELLKRYHSYLKHVHLNEMDGRYPGAGNYPFEPVLRALAGLRYDGWLSVEVFNFKPDGETVARSAATFLRRIIDRIQGEGS